MDKTIEITEEELNLIMEDMYVGGFAVGSLVGNREKQEASESMAKYVAMIEADNMSEEDWQGYISYIGETFRQEKLDFHRERLLEDLGHSFQ